VGVRVLLWRLGWAGDLFLIDEGKRLGWSCRAFLGFVWGVRRRMNGH